MGSEPKTYLGIGLGNHPAAGEVTVFSQSQPLPESRPQNPVQEAQDLKDAISAQLAELQSEVAAAQGEHREILEALALMLTDEELLSSSTDLIEQGLSASQAIRESFRIQRSLFTDDDILLSRLDDLGALVLRVQRRLLGEQEPALKLKPGAILLVDSLSAVEAAEIPEAIGGVICLSGDASSHASVILRSRGIPAVINCPEAKSVRPGSYVLVDPVGNRVVEGVSVDLATRPITFPAARTKPNLKVYANVGGVQDSLLAATSQAAGVGLFRTEMLYLTLSSPPSEELQTADYIEVLSAAPPGRFVARTFDAGNDKPVAWLRQDRDADGYSILTKHQELLGSQLRALRAASEVCGREIAVMAPSITDAEQASMFARLCRHAGLNHVGVMVEFENLAKNISTLEGVVNFVSVGTNDLSHRLAGVPRSSSGQVDYFDPDLIRLLARIASDSKLINIESSVCGESAADPMFALVLAGLGFTSLSMAPTAISSVLSALSALTPDEAIQLALEASAATSAARAREICRGWIDKVAN